MVAKKKIGNKKDIQTLVDDLLSFRKQRKWEKYHRPKDLALSLTLEAAEVLEHFQWKTDEEILKYVTTNKSDIAEELADVFNWVILLSNDLDIDILDASAKKIKKNRSKYPIKKAKGEYRKYTEF